MFFLHGILHALLSSVSHHEAGGGSAFHMYQNFSNPSNSRFVTCMFRIRFNVSTEIVCDKYSCENSVRSGHDCDLTNMCRFCVFYLTRSQIHPNCSSKDLHHEIEEGSSQRRIPSSFGVLVSDERMLRLNFQKLSGCQGHCRLVISGQVNLLSILLWRLRELCE